jgi:hypothetical protein
MNLQATDPCCTLWVLAVEVHTRQDIFRGKASSDYMHAEILAINKRCQELSNTLITQQYLEQHYGETFHMLKNQCGGIRFPLGMQK